MTPEAVADRPKLIYAAAGKTLLLSRGRSPDELALTLGEDALGRVVLAAGVPAAVEAGAGRWALRRAAGAGWSFDAVDEQSGDVAYQYRPRRLRAGGTLTPRARAALALGPSGWLRRHWTLRFDRGRVAMLEPLVPDLETTVAIGICKAVRGLPDATLVVLFAAAVVVLEFEMTGGAGA